MTDTKRPYDREGLLKLAKHTPDPDASAALFWAADFIRPPEPIWECAPVGTEAFMVDRFGHHLYLDREPRFNESSVELTGAKVLLAESPAPKLAFDWQDSIKIRPSKEEQLAEEHGITVEQVRKIQEAK